MHSPDEPYEGPFVNMLDGEMMHDYPHEEGHWVKVRRRGAD